MRSTAAAVLVLIVASLASFASPQETAAPAEPVTVILVRHADTDSPEPDPALTEAGAARAEALGDLLAASGVTHLFSTEFVRTRTTLAPLAERTGVEVEVVGAREAGRQLELLHSLPPGSVAVVAGHSNTVPAMAVALGTEPRDLEDHPPHGGVIPHATFDRMYVITLPVIEDGAPKLVELRY